MDRRQAEPREVEYSAIDFSSWNRKPPTDRKNEPQATETEYAELQKEGCREETAEGLGDVEEEVEVRTEAQVVEETAMVVEVEQREEVAAVGGEDEVWEEVGWGWGPGTVMVFRFFILNAAGKYTSKWLENNSRCPVNNHSNNK